MRNHAMLRNPFDNRPEIPLTEEGEKAFLAADANNAQRLKALDDFVSGSEYQNEIVPLVNSMR